MAVTFKTGLKKLTGNLFRLIVLIRNFFRRFHRTGNARKPKEINEGNFLAGTSFQVPAVPID
jgi:hypothetical protein